MGVEIREMCVSSSEMQKKCLSQVESYPELETSIYQWLFQYACFNLTIPNFTYRNCLFNQTSIWNLVVWSPRFKFRHRHNGNQSPFDLGFKFDSTKILQTCEFEPFVNPGWRTKHCLTAILGGGNFPTLKFQNVGSHQLTFILPFEWLPSNQTYLTFPAPNRR